jgi:WD40 repeat protein
MDGPCVDIRTVAFSHNGGLMAAAGRNGKVRVWSVSDGHVQQEISTEGRRIRTLAFSPDSSRIAVAGDGQTVDIFDAATGESIMKLPARPAKVYSLVFLDSQHLATGGSDNRVAVWDLDSKEAAAELVGHTGTVAALACDATGKVLVSGSYDTTLRIWNLADRQGPATAWRSAKSSR